MSYLLGFLEEKLFSFTKHEEMSLISGKYPACIVYPENMNADSVPLITDIVASKRLMFYPLCLSKDIPELECIHILKDKIVIEDLDEDLEKAYAKSVFFALIKKVSENYFSYKRK